MQTLHSDLYDEIEDAKRTGYFIGSDGKMHVTVAEAIRQLAESSQKQQPLEKTPCTENQ